MTLLEQKESLINFMADVYLDDNFQEKTGLNKFNEFVNNTELNLDYFTMGNFSNSIDNYMLVHISNIIANRTLREGGQLGLVNWGYEPTLSIYIQKTVTPTNAGYIGDLYMNALFTAIQYFAYDFNLPTPSEPNININKFFDNSKGIELKDFSSIDKVIINAEFTYQIKNPYMEG